MRIVWECNSLAFPVALAENGGKFEVYYGKQITRGLEYGAAAKQLGECIMHALACDGWLDSDKQRRKRA